MAPTFGILIAFGAKGADTLTGGSLRDLVFGLAGDDAIDGGAGRDSLLGDTGFDTAVFDGAVQDHAFSSRGLWTEVRDLATGEVDRLSSVERLLFEADRYTVNLDGTNDGDGCERRAGVEQPMRPWPRTRPMPMPTMSTRSR